MIPAAVRACYLRVVAGSMLLSSFVGCLALISHTAAVQASTDAAVAQGAQRLAADRFAAVLAAAISAVAFYHYQKLVEIRGSGRHSTELEDQCDAVRYSDWLVTLPALAVEINLIMNGKDDSPWEAVHRGWWMAAGLVVMVLFGILERETAATSTSTAPALSWLPGLPWFPLACGLLLAVFFGLAERPRTHDWAFWGFVVIPWSLYGVVAKAAQLAGNGTESSGADRNESVSVAKDILYGLLDIWCKAVLGLWTASKAAGVAY
jgi:bacteriorhodopsin